MDAVGCIRVRGRLDVEGEDRVTEPATGARAVRTVAFRPDGGVLASGGDDRSVRLWRVAEGNQLAKFTGHAGSVRSVAFSPDGGVLASAGDDGSVRLWDPSTGEQLAVLTGHVGSVCSVAFGPNAKVLASGGTDETLRTWAIASGAQIAILRSKPSAFISYTQEDRPIVDQLRHKLLNSGMDVWSDDQIPIGASIPARIDNAIRGSDIVFVLISPKSGDSLWFNAELAIAIAARGRDPAKVVVPVLVGDQEQIPPLLRDISWLDINSEDDMGRRLSELTQLLSMHESSPLLRTSHDVGAAIDLIEIERSAINRSAKAHDEKLIERELVLRTDLTRWMVVVAITLLAVGGIILAFADHMLSAGIVTTLNFGILAMLVAYTVRRREPQESALNHKDDDERAR